MTERFVQRVELVEWPEEAGQEIAASLREGLPRAAARRMTRLGLLCTQVLREMPSSPEIAIVYATRMSETRTLERYLDSFPDPSPTAFQASIHPAGAQQALIALARPTREFYPLCGGEYLLDQALQTCLLAEAPQVILVAGEERGGWMFDLKLGEERSFAFALHLTRREENAEAVLTRNGEPEVSSATTLASAFDRLSARENWKTASQPAGQWEWKWL